MPGGKDTTMPRHQEILQRAIGAPASGPACSGILGLKFSALSEAGAPALKTK
jgi:hypothetical protein